MTACHVGGSGGMLPQKILEFYTLRVLLVHVLTSKSTFVYAYSYLCFELEFAHGFCHTRKLNMHG